MDHRGAVVAVQAVAQAAVDRLVVAALAVDQPAAAVAALLLPGLRQTANGAITGLPLEVEPDTATRLLILMTAGKPTLLFRS